MKRDKNVVGKCFRDLNVIVRSTRGGWRFCPFVEISTENARDRAIKRNRETANGRRREIGEGTKNREIPLISIYEGVRSRGGRRNSTNKQKAVCPTTTRNLNEEKWNGIDGIRTSSEGTYMKIKRRYLHSEYFANSQLTKASTKTKDKGTIKEWKMCTLVTDIRAKTDYF